MGVERLTRRFTFARDLVVSQAQVTCRKRIIQLESRTSDVIQ